VYLRTLWSNYVEQGQERAQGWRAVPVYWLQVIPLIAMWQRKGI
jgi:hypothetical protein